LRYHRRVAAQDRLQVDVRHEPGRAVLRLVGELDLATVPVLQEQIEAIEVGTTATIVVLHLQALDFIDSTGLRTILSAHARLREHGCELAITRGSPQVQRLLEITRADEYLRVIAADEMLV
jgi:anti-sigma B factor antagonist